MCEQVNRCNIEEATVGCQAELIEALLRYIQLFRNYTMASTSFTDGNVLLK